MPIRRHHRWLYPIDWRELSASIRFRRAQGRCETCGRPHGRGARHAHDGPYGQRLGCGLRVELRLVGAGPVGRLSGPTERPPAQTS